MNIFGETSSPTTTVPLKADEVLLTKYTINREVKVAKLTAHISSVEHGDQAVRGVIYNSAKELVGASTDLKVLSNQGGEWLDLPLEKVLNLSAGVYYLGVNGGELSEAVQLGVNAAGKMRLERGADDFEDGPQATLSSLEDIGQKNLCIYATVFTAWEPPEVEDLQLGRLPWSGAQESFAGAARETVEATCGWHGTRLHHETGAFALVNREGPLAHMVGDRIKVTRDLNAIYVYVVGEEELEEDLSLSRRAFLQLGPLSADYLDVVVGVSE